MSANRANAYNDKGELDRSIPITLICNDIPELATLPVFEIANRDAARRMVDYLVSVGHRRIAHVTGPRTNVEARERVLGYRDGMAAAGLPVEESMIWDGSFRVEAGKITSINFAPR